MSTLLIADATGDAALHDWRLVHNEIIPTAPLSPDEVRERAGRNVLHVAYADGVLVGCTTVRPPADGTAAATVIARVLPSHRGQGFGSRLYAHGLERARAIGATGVQTVVLASSTEGLRFALARGFVEFDRYVLPGDTIAFVELRLP